MDTTTVSGVVYWLSRDPIGISGGLNLYAFCGNNPVNFVDPFGLIVVALDAVSQNAITQLKNSGSIINQQNVNQLQSSLNVHNVSAANGGSKNTTTDPANEAVKGTGSGSTTIWNPAGHGGFSGVSVLAHELQHAVDKDLGIIDRRDLDGNGYPDHEDRAVNTGNDYRKQVGENLRDDYGDRNACPKLR